MKRISNYTIGSIVCLSYTIGVASATIGKESTIDIFTTKDFIQASVVLIMLFLQAYVGGYRDGKNNN